MARFFTPAEFWRIVFSATFWRSIIYRSFLDATLSRAGKLLEDVNNLENNKKRLVFVYLLVFLVFDAVLWLVVRAFIDAQLAVKCLYALISAQSIYLIKILIDEILFPDPPELITSDLVIVEDVDKPIGNIYSLAYNWKRNRMGNPSDASNESDRIQVVTQPATNNIINEREADGLTRLMYLKDLGSVHKVKLNDGHYKYTT
jgi:hypothetical protein